MGAYVDRYNAPSSFGTRAYDFVSSQFGLTQTFAENSYNLTHTWIDDMRELLDSLTVPASGSIDVPSPEVPDLDFTKRPLLADLEIPNDWPEEAIPSPTLDPIPAVPDIDIPTPSYRLPQWAIVSKPDLDYGIPVPGEPGIPDRNLPAAPEIELPNPPVLQSIVFPEPPRLNVIPFDAVVPADLDIATPEGFNWAEDAFNSPVWNDLLNKVVLGIRYGGTGLDPDIEQAIWDAGKNKTQEANDKMFQEVEDYWASRRFSLPPGAMNGALIEASTEVARNWTEIGRQIMIEQAKLADANTRFITEKGIALETILRDFHNAQQNRALDAAKAAVSAAVEIYNALVARYNLNVEIYKAQVATYEAKQRAELTKIEMYKGQVEAARVSAEVQKLLVDIYEAQVGAQETRAKLYQAEVDGIRAQIEADGQRVNVFRAQIEAYNSRLGAEQNKVDMYVAELEGESTKGKTFEAEVRAYVAEVDGKKAQFEGNALKLDAVGKKNSAEIDKFKGELLGYTTKVDIIAKKVDAVVKGFTAETQAYAAESSAASAFYQAKVSEINMRIQEAQFLLQKAVAEIDSVTKGYIAIKELEVKGIESIANIEAQLAASAMNAVNASASLGESNSESESISLSNSLSESHSYEEA